MGPTLQKGDALLIVDVQQDFCPGGALPIALGDQVVPVLNRAIDAAIQAGVPVFASRDWHPAGHPSFVAQGGIWPVHCLQDSPGAAFHPDLELPADVRLVTKGTRFDKDQYSAFDDTGLAAELRREGVRRLWIGGLAEDVCVRATALDARKAGFAVQLIAGATRPVTQAGGTDALAEMRAAGVVIGSIGAPAQPSSILFTDLYELTMLQAYFEEGQRDEAVFSLFVRRLPERRNVLLACGLESVLRFLETARFDAASIDYLSTLGLFSDAFLESLAAFRFDGDVYAMPEGTPVFANEPILEIVAPLPQAQLVETFLLNQVTLQTTLASKAARVTAAARGHQVVDFGLRRMHGLDAGLKSARVFYLAGLAGTSNLAAGQLYGLPVYGTMAHSYIQSHEDEYRAFRSFARLYPNTTLLVDTYDTLAGVRHVVRLARELGSAFQIRAIRLDSGDLDALARATRHILDEAGLQRVQIFASGGLDEDKINRLLAAGVPIDGFGVGSDLAVSSDAPSLDAVYKLVSYRGRGRTKLSAGKGVLPGRKQVYRIEADGVAMRDVIAQWDEPIAAGRPLLVPVMQRGARLPAGRDTLDAARARTQAEIDRLPPFVRQLSAPASPYPVEISASLAHAHQALVDAMSSESPV